MYVAKCFSTITHESYNKKNEQFESSVLHSLFVPVFFIFACIFRYVHIYVWNQLAKLIYLLLTKKKKNWGGSQLKVPRNTNFLARQKMHHSELLKNLEA